MSSFASALASIASGHPLDPENRKYAAWAVMASGFAVMILFALRLLPEQLRKESEATRLYYLRRYGESPDIEKVSSGFKMAFILGVVAGLVGVVAGIMLLLTG
jgi:cytochrome b subunit of formate dehydrogenase